MLFMYLPAGSHVIGKAQKRLLAALHGVLMDPGFYRLQSEKGLPYFGTINVVFVQTHHTNSTCIDN